MIEDTCRRRITCVYTCRCCSSNY